MRPAAMRKFSTSHSQPIAADHTEPKRSVPGPTSPLQFICILLFSTLRKPIFVDVTTKAGLYLCAAAGGSLIFDFIHLPPSYFSNKYNLLNQLFVKWGWAWTCGSLAAFIVVSSFIYTGGNAKLMRAHLLRLLTGSACWYIITGMLNFVYDWTGRCHTNNATLASSRNTLTRNRYACHRHGGTWLGFDVSGHCFLLSMCNLWIMEELKCMQYWPKLCEILKPYDENPTSSDTARLRNIPSQQLNTMRSAFRRLTGTLRAVFCFTAALSILWDFMFFVTILYFHTMPSKLMGTMLGVLCWFFAYRWLFCSAKTGDWFGAAPGLPGDSPLNFTPRQRVPT